jgi:hypothetical protein
MKTYTVEVHDNGTKYWYRDGKYHREDGPAIEFADGDKFWYRDGKRHREDGPAIEYVNGNKVWYLNGKKLTEAEFNNHVKKNQKTCEGHVVEVDGVKYKLVRA